MFDVFHYEGQTKDEILNKYYVKRKGNQIIGYEDTPCFKMNLFESTEKIILKDNAFYGLFFIGGAGEIMCGNQKEVFKQGDQFFISASAAEVHIICKSQDSMKFLQCFGPKLG